MPPSDERAKEPTRGLDDPAFDAFRRHDVYGDMGKGDLPVSEKLYLYGMAVVLVPVRLLLSITLLLMFYLNLKLAHWVPTYGKTRVPTLIGRWLTRMCLGVLGFFWIRRVDMCPQPRSEDDDYPALIASNHASWVDTVMHFYLYFPASFIMKKGVFKVPIIGDIGVHIKCIGVERERQPNNDQQGMAEVITKRLKEEGKKSPRERHPVLLFPEGTTTNGTSLINFKSGAFIAGVPAKPVVLLYKTGRVSPSWETIDIKQHLLLMLANPVHSVTVIELPTYYPDEAEKCDPKLYAQNLREHMAKQCKLGLADASLTDKREYHEMIKEKYKNSFK